MAGKLYIASAFSPNMLPLDVGQSSIVKITKITADVAATIVAQTAEFISAVGHEGTAQLLSAQLNLNVPVNRISITLDLAAGDKIIVALPTQRLPEGKVLSYEELCAIPIAYYLIEV
jgi:hypothetical protein